MSTAPGNYVRLTRLIKAPRPRVYNAWIDPAVRMQWWRAAPEMQCTQCDIDATVGGAFRVNMCQGDKQFVAFGKFVTLDPPRKLAFTWNWEHDPSFGGDSLVTVELFETEFDGRPATELVLLHERLDTPQQRSDHTTGWLGCLKSLGGMFAADAG